MKKMKTGYIFVVALIACSFALTFGLAQANTESVNDTPVSKVNSITLSGTGAEIKWSVDGYSASGFKVVWSKNSDPVYPCRSGDQYHYYSDPAKTSDTLDAFSGSGYYHVRVCEYLGGRCGVYSNQITVNLAGKEGAVNSTCTDTDSGESIYVLGKNHGNNDSGAGYKYYDECVDSHTLKEQICFKNEGGTWSPSYKKIACANGCRDGVCLKDKIACTMDYNPVCGKDGKTYSNKCMATSQNGVVIAYEGECKKDGQIIEIEEKSKLLANNQLDQILDELRELRNLVKEQQNQITYLKSLLVDISKLTSAMQNSINSFITYGVDENTKKLGEGERAAVMHSYKEAFGKLPEDEGDFADAIKIANGRWPSEKSAEAENNARENFRKVYGREPNADNASDNAAVTIMAYGLRQRAENRNLMSEKNAMAIFKGIYGHIPGTTE